jgi:hypothetical protein
MTNKQLAEHFQKCATHHIAMAKAHHAMAAGSNGAAATFHKAAQGLHEDHAEHCVECAKTCASNAESIDTIDVSTLDKPTDKAAVTSFGMAAAMGLDKVAPTRVHGVVASSPSQFIPRPGGPGVQAPEDATRAIDSLKR